MALLRFSGGVLVVEDEDGTSCTVLSAVGEDEDEADEDEELLELDVEVGAGGCVEVGVGSGVQT